MIERISLINGWRFSPEWKDGMEKGGMNDDFTDADLPHSPVELPLTYFDERSYQKISCYRKTLPSANLAGGKRAILRFEGVMAVAGVWLNGKFLGEHKGGYTPFEFDATETFRGDGTDVLTVRADATERDDVPPFGGQIDYLTYAGIYREVYLDISAPVRISNVKVECAEPLAEKKEISARLFLQNANSGNKADAVSGVTAGSSGAGASSLEASVRLLDSAGKVLAESSAAITAGAGASEHTVKLGPVAGLSLWTPDKPVLYTVECSVRLAGSPAAQSSSAGNAAAGNAAAGNAAAGNALADTFTTRYGFRTAEFRTEGFFLNGERFKIVGLNRHQAWPYVGYAMPARAQKRDADILKNDLRVNLVRTSHYPQSIHFIDRCDELGLLVFEEIPGWQHIGGAAWKETAKEHVREMIERDWNHPSVILWGVRINESQDDDPFYKDTNAIAHRLDATRQTGGVRYITESHLLEDVYTMNDFVLDGGAVALRDQRTVTGLDHDVPYMITEYNGHMYPTKKWDCEERQNEHSIRHLRVQNASFGNPKISGAIGWCAFDYNTHKDFGSGDRICHHGVTDIFRIPKFAGFVYASQTPPDRGAVLKPVTWWARGERSIGGILPLLVLSNCDEIGLRFGAHEEIRIKERSADYLNLPYPPFVVGLNHIPPEKLGEWGMKWEDGVITGYVEGKKAAEARFACDPVPSTLFASADDATLTAGAKDATRIVVAVQDSAGNPLPFADTIVRVEIEGPARIQGPATFALLAGSRAFWVESSGTAGTVKVKISTDGLASREIPIEVR